MTSSGESKGLLPWLGVAAALFGVAAALGYLSAPHPALAGLLPVVAETLAPLRELSSLELVGFIFLNNALKALAVILLGGLLGVIPIIFVSANGFVLGLAVYQGIGERGVAFVISGLLPHGVIELPALLLAAAAGLEVAWGVGQSLRGRPGRVVARLRRALRLFFWGIAPTLLLAALIEVFLTPLLVRG